MGKREFPPPLYYTFAVFHMDPQFTVFYTSSELEQFARQIKELFDSDALEIVGRWWWWWCLPQVTREEERWQQPLCLGCMSPLTDGLHSIDEEFTFPHTPSSIPSVVNVTKEFRSVGLQILPSLLRAEEESFGPSDQHTSLALA